MITEEFAARFGDDWINAWNAHDLDQVMAHYHEEVVFTSPFVVKLNDEATGTIKDKQNLRNYFGRALAAYPDLKFVHFKTLVSINSVVLYYRSVNDLYAAECMEFNEAGKVVRVTAHYSR